MVKESEEAIRHPYGSRDPLNVAGIEEGGRRMQIGPMKAVINGDPGRLHRAEVSEVWKEGEVVVMFRKPGEGAERVLLKGANTKWSPMDSALSLVESGW